jgi:folate-binding protein YgfZ
MAPPAAEQTEYLAATTAVAWFDASSREQVVVTGPDRVSFVQGMVTNDVEALSVSQACPICLLTPKGAMVGDGRVLKLEGRLVLDTGPGRGEAVRGFLEKYLISEEAETAVATDLAVLELFGPGAPALLQGLPGRVGVLAQPPEAWAVLVERSQWPQVLAALASVPRLSEATREVLRVEAGVPRFGVDLTEVTIPLEANLESHLNYKKGCYIGQEVIARATYRGQMNKRLMGLRLSAEAAPGTELQREGKKVGWLTSVIQSPRLGLVALGYVHRDHLTPGGVLQLASGGTATVAALPFALTT